MSTNPIVFTHNNVHFFGCAMQICKSKRGRKTREKEEKTNGQAKKISIVMKSTTATKQVMRMLNHEIVNRQKSSKKIDKVQTDTEAKTTS